MSPEERAEEAALLRARRDFAGSERELRAALEEAPADPRLLTDLAATVSQLGRADEMEALLRQALAAAPGHEPAAEPLAAYLLSRRRTEEALAVTAPLVEATRAPGLLRSHVEALRALGRVEEGLTVLARLAELLPHEAEIQRELAATLVDAGRFGPAETLLDALRAGGREEGADWMIRGFMLRRQRRWDEAEAAYREAVDRAPDQAEAHRELSDLIWSRTGDAARATAALDAAIAADPGRGILRQMKARLLQAAGDSRGAYAALEPVVGRTGSNPGLNATASQAAIAFDPELALSLAQRAMTGMPDNPTIISIVAEAALAAGKPRQALELANRMRRLAGNNQHGIALTATAWRALGEDRYRELNDYARLVRPDRLDTPQGWDSLDAYLADLRAALHALHDNGDRDPVGQSVRGGSQTEPLEHVDDPVIKAFFQAIDGPVKRYLETLGPKDLGGRNTGRYAVSGAWSVNLAPGGGRHANHLHPWGWLSSACYLEVPDAVGGEGREGWLAFGEPGIPTVPALAAEHWVKPEPGMVVLFPSYMWHGTTPFGGDQTRLTAAFDVVPA